MSVGIQFQPVDTWFFRDAAPFTAQSTPQEQVGSLFPPHPPTAVGAARAELARLNGWNGTGRWPPELCEVLGNGPDDLGKLSFGGPFLLRDEQPLFRAPRHLLGTANSHGWRPAALLRPGSPVACDLDDAVRLPELPDSAGGIEKLKPGNDAWLTAAGMNAVLGGRLPEAAEVVPSAALWEEEARIGLERERHTRTAKEGMLYSTRHVRPRRGVALGMHVAGVPADWVRPFDRVMPLGGESRLAACREWTLDLRLGAPVERIRSARRVALVALSPLDLAEAVHPGTPVVGLDGVRVVCACLERPHRVGGWDSLARRPLPLRPVLPPGSTLFCEMADGERFAAAATPGGGLVRIGTRQEWGFGLVALGIWPTAN